MDPVLVSVGNDFKVWETSTYSQLYSHVPEKKSAGPVSVNCTSWSADTSAVASFIKDESKILLTFYKNNKYYSHEILVQGIENLSYIQFPRTSQNHMYISSKNELHYYDLTRHKSRKSFALKSDISCLVSNKSDSYVAIGCKNGSIVLLTTISNQLSQPFTADGCAGQHVTSVRYSPVRTGFLGASCESGVLSFWDCNANKNIFNISDHLAPCTSFAFSPLNDSLAVSCGLDKKLICHDTKSKKSVFNLQLEFPCTSVDFDTDGATVAVGTSRGKILVYDLRNTSRASKTLQAHSGRVTALAFKPKIDKMNVTQVMSAVKSVSKSKLRSHASGSSLKTVQEEREKENLKPDEELSFQPRNLNKEGLARGKSLTGLTSGQQDPDIHFTPSNEADIFSPVENENYNRRESISSQLFSPLKEADISFNTPNPSSRGSSRRTSDARLSTEGLFSPVRDSSETKRTPLATPLTSPFLSSIQEETGGASDNTLTGKSIDRGGEGEQSEAAPRLSLETLTEVAASVTKRAEGSPEYLESRLVTSDTDTRRIASAAAQKVKGIEEESRSESSSHRGGMVKPLSATKSTLRDNNLHRHHNAQDIVRVGDLHRQDNRTVEDMSRTKEDKVQDIVRLRELELEDRSLARSDLVTNNTSKKTEFASSGSSMPAMSSEVEKFFSESRVLSSELQTVSTAFPAAMLDSELSPRHVRPLSTRRDDSCSSSLASVKTGEDVHRVPTTAVRPAGLRTAGRIPSSSAARGSLHSSASSENEIEGFNRRYIEEVVSEAMEEWCAGVEHRIVNMHYSLIQIMQQHQEETRRYIEEIHQMEEIKRENERLQEENEQLKSIF